MSNPTPQTHELVGYCNATASGIAGSYAELRLCLANTVPRRVARYRVLRDRTTGDMSLHRIPLDMIEDDWGKPRVLQVVACYLYKDYLCSYRESDIKRTLAYLTDQDMKLCSATILYDNGVTRVLTPDEARKEAGQ